MSESDNLRKHALECMRLTADDQGRDIYTCPAGKTLTTMRKVVNDDCPLDQRVTWVLAFKSATE